jgi:hypothetical protein
MSTRESGLILRDREQARFAAIMARQTTTFALVKGSTNSGKSTLMHYVRRMAEGQGWRTIPSTEQRDISLITTSTPPTLAHDVAELLGDGAFPPDELVERLIKNQPVMLVVEAHALNPAFAEWFAGRLVDGLKQAGARAVIAIVADLAVDVRMLRKRADEVIHLGPFDPDDVRKELELFRNRVSPPLTDEELVAYATQAKNDPMVLISLVRLLHYAATGAQ